MRTVRWTFLAAVVALTAACSAEATQVASPSEPPPAEAPEAIAPEVASEPTAAAVVPAAPAPPPAPAPAPTSDDDDNPLPEGVGGRPVAATAAAPGTASTGGVRAAAAPAGRPTPTGRIEIPAIGLNHLTYEGIDIGTINYGPSHWPGKPLPGQWLGP